MFQLDNLWKYSIFKCVFGSCGIRMSGFYYQQVLLDKKIINIYGTDSNNVRGK